MATTVYIQSNRCLHDGTQSYSIDKDEFEGWNLQYFKRSPTIFFDTATSTIQNVILNRDDLYVSHGFSNLISYATSMIKHTINDWIGDRYITFHEHSYIGKSIVVKDCYISLVEIEPKMSSDPNFTHQKSQIRQRINEMHSDFLMHLGMHMSTSEILTIAYKIGYSDINIKRLCTHLILKKQDHVFLFPRSIIREYQRFQKPYNHLLQERDISHVPGIREAEPGTYACDDELTTEENIVQMISERNALNDYIIYKCAQKRMNSDIANTICYWVRYLRNDCIEYSIDDTLTGKQRQAVRMACTTRVSLLTGGPGTGKTHVIRSIAQFAKSSVVILSLTGMCVQSIQDVLTKKVPCRTIDSFLANQSNMKYDILIVDEATLLDNNKAYKLLKYTRNAHILFVGDTHQLQPIGKGAFFHSLVQSGCLPHINLTQNFRQSSTSDISRCANAIRHGDTKSLYSILSETNTVKVCYYSKNAVKKHMQKHNYIDFQIISPYNDERSTAMYELAGYLNGDTHQLMNGTKVMITENDNRAIGAENRRYSNGTMAVKEGKSVRVLSSDMKIPQKEIRMKLGYICTVHKTQGQSYEHGAIVFANIPYKTPMVNRQMLYTAITRFKHSVVIYCDEPNRIMAMAMNNSEKLKNSRIKTLLLEAVNRA